MPSPWVVVAVCRWHAQCLFMPVHVSDGTLDFRIGTMALHQVLLWQDLPRLHNCCTEVAGGPIELL